MSVAKKGKTPYNKYNNILQFWNINTGEMVLGKYCHLRDTSRIKLGIGYGSVVELKQNPGRVIKGWVCLGTVT